MKKLLAAIAATLLFGASVFAEGYLSANDLSVGTINGDQKEEDGFVLHGATDPAAKQLIVEDKSKDPALCGEEKVTNRISSKGSGSANERSISFPAAAGETVLVYTRSSNKSSQRSIKVVNADGVEVAELVAAADSPDKTIKPVSFKAPAKSTYTLYPTGGGCYFYYIQIKK